MRKYLSLCVLLSFAVSGLNADNDYHYYINLNKVVDDKLTVEFFISRALPDHYSAFVYTNDNDKIRELDRRTNLNKGWELNQKLDEHWYRVSY